MKKLSKPTHREVRLSKQLGLSTPYDWSNSGIPEPVLIIRVLQSGNLIDIARCVRFFGIKKMRKGLSSIEDPLILNISKRKLRHAELATSTHTVQTLFESKSIALMTAVRFLDLYDLMILVEQHGYRLVDIVNTIKRIDGCSENQALTAIEVLAGNIPVDKDDPGFESIGLNIDLKDIYAFFEPKIREFEVDMVKRSLSKTGLKIN